MGQRATKRTEKKNSVISEKSDGAENLQNFDMKFQGKKTKKNILTLQRKQKPM